MQPARPRGCLPARRRARRARSRRRGLPSSRWPGGGARRGALVGHGRGRRGRELRGPARDGARRAGRGGALRGDPQRRRLGPLRGGARLPGAAPESGTACALGSPGSVEIEAFGPAFDYTPNCSPFINFFGGCEEEFLVEGTVVAAIPQVEGGTELQLVGCLDDVTAECAADVTTVRIKAPGLSVPLSVGDRASILVRSEMSGPDCTGECVLGAEIRGLPPGSKGREDELETRPVGPLLFQANASRGFSLAATVADDPECRGASECASESALAKIEAPADASAAPLALQPGASRDWELPGGYDAGRYRVHALDARTDRSATPGGCSESPRVVFWASRLP